MTPAQWQRAKELLERALEIDPEALPAFLEQECPDPEIRQEVLSLAASHHEAGQFFERSPIPKSPTDTVNVFLRSDHLIGQQLGAYRITREIGEGGMGAVYRAVRADDEFQRQVAIKIIRRGMDTDFIVRRFRNERQILASLEHPNIARLLDGGTTPDGLPYLVMEYIEGQPLDDYCDQKRLNTVQRIKLFRKVCDAVQYAHRNLVVHRDIKPGNILVTTDGEPKLLDFGIAKLLNNDFSGQGLDPTVTVMRLMTPDYASPEQVRGDKITTASDVYSLGVVLYELLTGHRPYRTRSRTPHEMLRVICEEQPLKPSTAVSRAVEVQDTDGTPITLTPEKVSSTREGEPGKLRRKLAGDLDTILLTALRKEPERRYSSVEQFSEDLLRHLDGRPVTAESDTVLYRLRKFASRNKVGVLASLLVFLSLAGGVIIATREARRAQKRFNDVRQLAHSFVFEINDAIEKLPGSTAARELLVKRSLAYLDSLAQEAGNDAELQRELAASYQRVGDVQGRPGNANLGDSQGALKSYRKALGLFESVRNARPDDRDAQRDLALIYGRLSDASEPTAGNEGLVLAEKALAIFQNLLEGDPANVSRMRDLGIGYDQLADQLVEREKFEEALQIRMKQLALYAKVVEMKQQYPTLDREIALVHKRIGGLQGRLKQYASSMEHYREAAKWDSQRLARDPESTDVKMDLSFDYSDLGWVHSQLKDFKSALANHEQALQLRQEVSNVDPRDVRARSSVSRSQVRIGLVYHLMGDERANIKACADSVKTLEQLLSENPQSAVVQADLADTLYNYGVAHRYLAEDAKAAAPERHAAWRDSKGAMLRAKALTEDLVRRKYRVKAMLDRLTEINKAIEEIESHLKSS